MYRLLLLEALHHGFAVCIFLLKCRDSEKTVDSLAAIQEHKRCI